MSKNFVSQEYIAGSTREKIRAFEAAQAAVNYAESYLSSYVSTNGKFPASTTCAGSGSESQGSSSTTGVSVCKTDIAYPEQTGSWTAANQLPTSSMTISTSGGVATYYAQPLFYIYDLDCLPIGSPECHQVYRITALGYGGNSNAVAVIQSVYSF